jgi:hypothetical protein
VMAHVSPLIAIEYLSYQSLTEIGYLSP